MMFHGHDPETTCLKADFQPLAGSIQHNMRYDPATRTVEKTMLVSGF